MAAVDEVSEVPLERGVVARVVGLMLAATIVLTPLLGPAAGIGGIAAELLLAPRLLKNGSGRYKSRGAPIWSFGLGVVATIATLLTLNAALAADDGRRSVGFMWILSMFAAGPAVVFGILGLRRVDRQWAVYGIVLAAFGLVTGAAIYAIHGA